MDHQRDPHEGKEVLGWAINVDFPEWGFSGLRAKVDTGARTSALHVENLRLIGTRRVSFQVVLSRKNHKSIDVEAPIIRIGRVRSSTGEYTKRIFVRTRVKIGTVEKEVEISLVSREKMMFRMLLGRTALEKDFIVDVSKRSTAETKTKKRSNP